MATYCNAMDVAALLGISAWPDAGPVTESIIESWISRMEDVVDRKVGSSFKLQTSTDEYHDYPSSDYRADVGVPIYLDHDNLFTFDSTKGDKVEVWDGSSYEQLQTTGTQGRGNDYWFDLKKGVLYLRLGSRGLIVQGIRVTYRHGNYSAVPGDIVDATALLVAARVAILDGTVAILISEGKDVPPEERVRLWQKEANDTLASRRGFKSIGALPGAIS